MTNRTRSSRRTVLRIAAALGVASATLTGSATAGARSGSDSATERHDPSTSTAESAASDVDQYVAVVDRVVDGEHVVILLEEGCAVVDQLVVSKSEYEDLEERDVLVVVVEGNDLLAYQHIPQKPPCD